MWPKKHELISLLRIAAVMTIFSALLILSGVVFKHIPFIGMLPGDIELNLQTVSLYLPITTCVLFAAIITVIAYFLQDVSNNE